MADIIAKFFNSIGVLALKENYLIILNYYFYSGVTFNPLLRDKNNNYIHF